MYDAIVVGARVAGSPTAMLLARKGYRVLLVDRAGFPSDTLSTHYIHQPGVARLERWGLLPRVVRSGCPPIRNYTLDVGPFALNGSPPPAGEAADAYSPRRSALDQVLVEAAADAGAEVRERFAVKDLVTDGARVTGIRGRTAGGATVTERARIVIGADGMNSLVARSVDAPAYDVQPALTCAYYTYWSGVEMEGAELYPRPGRMIVAAPTSNDLVVTIVFWPNGDFHRVRADIEGNLLASLELAPGLAEADIATLSLYDELEAAGRVPATAEYDVTAISAHDPEAALLGLAPGAPALLANTRSRDAYGRLLEVSTTVYRGDRYRFQATLTRPRTTRRERTP